MTSVAKNSRIGTFRDWRFPHAPISGYRDTITDREESSLVLSESHPRKNGRYVSGGTFFLKKRRNTKSGDSVRVYRVHESVAYEGFFETQIAATQFGKLKFYDYEAQADFDKLKELGAEAWAAMKPATPDFSAGASLYELREVPGMFQSAVRDVRKNIKHRRAKLGDQKKWYTYAGEMYLAAQFGWIPLYKDIRDFTESFGKRHKTLDQLIKDEGKAVRRRRELKKYSIDDDYNNRVSGTESGNPNMLPYLVSQCYAPNWNHHYQLTYKRRVWCAGRFRYILPPGPRTEGWKRMMYRRIMGGRLTPSQLYAIFPWSWLVDYFTGLGSFLDATSAGVEDRLICDYAYLMRSHETVQSRTESQNVYVSSNGRVRSVAANLSQHEIFKTRVTASPFGFGLNRENLTPYQLSIMGALGLTFT